jgi:hypothetical protein
MFSKLFSQNLRLFILVSFERLEINAYPYMKGEQKQQAQYRLERQIQISLSPPRPPLPFR